MPDLVLQQRGALPSATTQGHPLEDRRRPFDRHSADSHPRGSSSTWSRLRACRRTVVRVTAEGQATRTTRGDEDSAAEVFPLIRVSGPCGYPKTSGNDLALVTTDLTATPEEIIARYAARWSIEVTFVDVKNVLGIGQVRNRVPKAVERTVPCGLVCHSLLILLVHPARLPRHRHRAPGPRRRGRGRRPNLPLWTCSPASVRSSPPDFSH